MNGLTTIASLPRSDEIFNESTHMTLEEIRKQKDILERSLTSILVSNLDEFYKTTGVRVKAVDCIFTSLFWVSMNAINCGYQLRSVRVEVETGL